MKILTNYKLLFACIIGLPIAVYAFLPSVFEREYSRENIPTEETVTEFVQLPEEVILPVDPPVTHILPPEQVKAIYMSSWVAGTTDFKKKLIDLIDRTEVNAIVVDIKDYTGKIAFTVPNAALEAVGSMENRIPDIKKLTKELHDKNIYIIGRIAVFQDPYFVKLHPEFAVKQKDQKTIWKDRKGITWMDAGTQEVWDYTVAIAKASYEVGFDEINFDYVRFPTDGNMKDIYFPHSEGKVKADVLESFFSYLHDNLTGTGIVTSADLFGMVTTNTDDLGIGQVLDKALPYFDYIAPMVYPSHFPPGWNGYAKPATRPYEVIKYSMEKAVARTIALGFDSNKLRPWLQDFNYGATYTAEMVRAQIKATNDVGLDSWMLWDPGNTYTEAGLLSE
jgi:hypothetical protein